MKPNIRLALLPTMIALAFVLVVNAQQPQPPVVKAEIALEIRTQQLAQVRMQQEYQAIQKQIDDSPLGKRIKELAAKYEDANGKIQSLGKSVCGDAKLFVLDIEAMKCVAPKVETVKGPEKVGDKKPE